MNKAASRTPASRLYLTLALVFVAVVFVYRLTLFSGIEPRSDQAFFSWWVQGLAQADQLLPSAQSGETFLVALERDDDSFLHRLVRPIYGKSIAIFTAVPLALRLAAAWIFGDSYAVQIASSLFASALIVLVIGVLPLSAFRSRLALTAGLALFFAASASYLHYFSPWGNHNFGVLFLLIAAGATERALRALKAQSEGYGRTLLVAAALQMVALYAHWTNVFLLPTATVFCWLWADIPLRRKLIAALLYGAVLVLITLPFWLFVGLEIDRPGNAETHSAQDLFAVAFSGGAADIFVGMATRVLQWVTGLSALFSLPGVLLGTIGVGLLALREGVYLPLALTLTHFGVSVIISLFAAAHFRTDLYVIPFLVLGLAYCVALALQNLRAHLAIGLIVLGLATGHSWQQVGRLFSPQNMARQSPLFWQTYFQGQGDVAPMAVALDNLLPERAMIFTWGYGMQYMLRNYGIERPGRDIAPTLLTLLGRFDQKSLTDLILRRKLSIPTAIPIFALIDHGTDRVNRETVRQGLASIMGPTGFDRANNVTLEPMANWSLQSSWPRNVTLYRVRTSAMQ